MPLSFDEVQPGDVISASLMNFVLDKLQELDGRVSSLEDGSGGGAGQPFIERFEPATQVALGQLLVIHGQNFLFPPENNSVTLDGEPVTEFRLGSTSDKLRVVVPTTISVPAGGRNVVIEVSNRSGADQRLYRLLPEVPVVGDPPLISAVAPVTGTRIFVQEDILITGENFAEEPADNIIVFRVSTASGDREYRDPVIGPAQPDPTTEIVVTVPDIEEIPAGGGSRTVTLEVGVGAHIPATTNISVRR